MPTTMTAPKRRMRGLDDAALDELCADGCEEGDDEGSGPEDEAGVDGAVAVEGLEELRDHRG